MTQPVCTVEHVVDAPLGSVGMALEEWLRDHVERGWTLRHADGLRAELRRGAAMVTVSVSARGRSTAVQLAWPAGGGRVACALRRLRGSLALAALGARARRIHRSGPPQEPPGTPTRGWPDELRHDGLAVIEIPVDR